MSENEQLSWERVAAWLAAQPPGCLLRLPKARIKHPLDSGAARSFGLPFGQSADYRWAGLFVREFPGHYEAHIEHADASQIGRPVDNEREALIQSAAAFGGMLGALFGGTRDATEVGAGLGALFGAASLTPEGSASAGEPGMTASAGVSAPRAPAKPRKKTKTKRRAEPSAKKAHGKTGGKKKK